MPSAKKSRTAEALETLHGQFQQITADLELSFDDMRASGNPQDRRAEIQQLRKMRLKPDKKLWNRGRTEI